MYSVILAALITTGAEQTQAWHHCHGCWSACSCSCSCYGGYGGYAFWPSCSCYGCSCSGYYASYGCSCYGCSCYGCSCGGGCWSGSALWTVEYSHWCTGCYGSWCSGSAGTGWSYYSGPAYLGGVCSGCCCGGIVVAPAAAPAVAPPPAKAAPSAPAGARVPVSPTSDAQTVATRIAPAAAPARVVVSIPEDAKLWVDQVACPLKGETRTFSTAALSPGSRYFYNLTIESAQGSRETRRIELTPGQTTEVDFRAVATVKR